MRILFVNTGSYINMDMMNHIACHYRDVQTDEFGFFLEKNEDIFHNEPFEEKLWERLKKNDYDLVISTNFFPMVARICKDVGLKYIAWSYDTPMGVLPCDEMKYDTNFIFLFDRLEVEYFRSLGMTRFFYLPLAINTDRYDRYMPSSRFQGDVSFMGRLYRSQLPKIKEGLDQSLIEYIDKLVSTQRSIVNKYVVEDLISPAIIEEFNRQYQESGRSLRIKKEHLSFAVSEQVTYLDRIVLLEMLGRRFDTHFYTYNVSDSERELLRNVKIHGELNYFTEMPVMFKSSKINISGSFRAAKSAVPLRALDIMGCGSFLLSSPQLELLEYFEDGKEMVTYSSESDAVEKAAYYLEHEDERKRIADAGYEKVKRVFNYSDRFREMFKIAEIKAY